MKKFLGIALIVIGVISIALGVVVFIQKPSTGYSPYWGVYGADFYTEMARTTAEATQNISSLSKGVFKYLKLGFGSILLVTGLTLAVVGIYFLISKKEEPEVKIVQTAAPVKSTAPNRTIPSGGNIFVPRDREE